MIYQKPNKKNVFYQICRNIADSNNGLKIMLKESGTVKRLIPLEIVAGIVLGILCHFEALEYVIMAAVILIVFNTETFNSAIEEVNDLVTLEENPRVKRSKDIASAGVWTWHLVYIGIVLAFIIMHIAGFPWWKAIIPG